MTFQKDFLRLPLPGHAPLLQFHRQRLAYRQSKELDDETFQPAYLFCMLYYIVKAEYMAIGETESLEYEACGRIRIDISVTSYMKDIKKVA